MMLLLNFMLVRASTLFLISMLGFVRAVFICDLAFIFIFILASICVGAIFGMFLFVFGVCGVVFGRR